MEKQVVNVDVDSQSPFVQQLQKCFPQFEIVAKQATPNDHANARAFSHLASKLIELEVPVSVPILDIGSAPARRMYSEHQYHCVCPMKSPEDPDRLMNYANKLVEKSTEIMGKRLDTKLQDLKQLLETPDMETPSICFHTDETCRMHAEVSIMQDLYINAPASIYHQALRGVRRLYWIGFDTTQFMFGAMAGGYPTYNTNWADEKVLSARNIGLCSSPLREGLRRRLPLIKKKYLKPGQKVLFSVGSTLYPESRSDLQSWHLPSVFHLKGKEKFTCRCDTVVNCDGYVMKKITISPGIYGAPAGYAVTDNSEGFLLCKTTDVVGGERVSFPVTTYIPAVICDQMTGILATDVSAEDAQKLLVGLNQRIVINGKTNRNMNTMRNHLLPAVALGFSKWAKERRSDMEDERPLSSRSLWNLMWSCKTKKTHSFYRPPGTQTIVRVPSSFSAFPLSSIWTTSLPYSFRQKIKLIFAGRVKREIISITDGQVTSAQEKAVEHREAAEAELQRQALPPLVADRDTIVEEISVVLDDLTDDVGAALVETPRGAIKVVPSQSDKMIGKYLIISPQAVLRNPKLTQLHPLAEQTKIITHSGRNGRYAVQPYDGRVLVPTGSSIPWSDFLALSESATLVYNEREFINRKLHYIAINGPAKNTDEEQYRVGHVSTVDDEYVFDVDKRVCVKREEASGLVLSGELTNPPYHEMALEGLKSRPATPYKVETIGVIGTPGSGKSAIIKSTVSSKDLVTSGKKENCTEIENDVKKQRGMTISARTVDSVLINGCSRPVDILYVDEAFSCHSGTLIALIAIVKPRVKVVLCGDPKQCGFFNMMQLKVHFNDPERDICTETHYKYISRRCTRPVTAIVSTLHYDGKMKTTNPSTTPIIIDTTGNSKPKKGDIILTCFRGWVKQLQIEYPGFEVMTAAASQGLTRKGVFAVRQKVNENPLYAITSEHVNVLLTRTEDRIIWKTLQGDPWIKQLSDIPKGDFTATMDDWLTEHNTIMNAIGRTSAGRDAFSCKSNVCWAKSLAPILETAGIKLTAEQWADFFPQFARDEAHSATYALDVLCTKYFGLDLTSGLFSNKMVSLAFHPASPDRRVAHWDNATSEMKFGFNAAVAKELSARYQIMRQAGSGAQLDLIAGKPRQPSSQFNLVPVNRNLPHALALDYVAYAPKPIDEFVNSFKAYHVLLVSAQSISTTKKLTWVAPPGTVGADHHANLVLGFPSITRADLVVIDVPTAYRHHHYQQCEDHAATMKQLSRAALSNLKPGGTLAIKAYGYADRNSEDIVSAIARKFTRVSAVRPASASSNTEIFLVFRQFDNNRHRQFTLHHLNRLISSIYEGESDGVASAPAYRTVRGNIVDSTASVTVNIAKPDGAPMKGVGEALHKRWPDAFTATGMEPGTATLVRTGGKSIIHAVGPDYRKVSESEGHKIMQNAYFAVADLINKERFTSVAIPLLGNERKAGQGDRVDLSVNGLFTALDRTDADVSIYCLDKKRQSRIDDAIKMKENVTALLDEDLEVDDDLVWVHPASCLKGHRGYSTDKGKLYSYMEGTKFNKAALDMAEIYTLFPDVKEANEQICQYALGEPMDAIREKCPVESFPSSSPPKTVPCLCVYAMSPERVHRLRSTSSKNFTVCSSFPLPKYQVKNVQKVICTKVMLFNPSTPEFKPARVFVQPPADDAPAPSAPEPTPSRSPSPDTGIEEPQEELPPFSETNDSIRASLDNLSVYSMASSFESEPQSVTFTADVHSSAEPTPVAPPRTKRDRKRAAMLRASSETLSFGDFLEGEVDELASISFGDFSDEERDQFFGPEY